MAYTLAIFFIETVDLADVVLRSDIVISVCPPSAAIQVASDVAMIRSDGFLYIDANTVSPGTMREISGKFGPHVVADVALTGAPGSEGLTVWVSGHRNSDVCDLFGNTKIERRTISDVTGQAATLMEASAVAGADVEHAVRTHLRDIGYDVDREAARIAERAPKAGRWVGEMEESAEAMREFGLPAGFSEAASATYRRIADQRG